MKHLKLLRYTILFLIALSIFFVFFNFKKQPSIELPEENTQSFQAQTVIENGENVLYSHNEEVAKLFYKRAVQKDKRLLMSQVKIKWKTGAEISTEKAEYFKSEVLFKTETKGIIPEENLSVVFQPKSFFKDNVLKGSNAVFCFFENGKLTGKNYKFDFSNDTLFANENVNFLSENISLLSRKTLIDFKNRIFRFFLGVGFAIKGGTLRGQCDYVNYLPDKSLFSLFGRCVLKTDGGIFFFNQGKITFSENGEMLKCDGLFDFSSEKYVGKGTGLELSGKKGFCRYFETEYLSFHLSAVNCEFEKSKSEIKLTGEFPYIFNKVDGRVLKGEKIILENGELKVVSPVFKDTGMFAVSDICLLSGENGDTLFFPNEVSGGFEQFAFKGEKAEVGKNKTFIYNAYVNELENPKNFFKANKVELNQDFLKGKGKVEFNIENAKGKGYTVHSESVVYNFFENSATLEQKVTMQSDKIKIFPKKALVFGKFAILFQCKFNVESSYSGTAQIAVINFDRRYSYLYNARVKDYSGNVLKGGKLTLDNQTDRIFVEKAENSKQVEVKIKL